MENGSAPSTQEVSNQEGQPESSAGFDGYRSVSNPNLMIFVAKDVVPPFRFKAGGWELFPIFNRPRLGNEGPHRRKGIFPVSCKRGSDLGGGAVRSANPVRRAGDASGGKLTCELSWPR